MRRREFITLLGGVAGWPLAASAQQGRVRRIGWLGAAKDHPYQIAAIAAFRKGLADLGWVEGRNVAIEQRWSTGETAQNNQQAQELVALAPDVLVGTGGASVTPFLAATRTIPIVFAHVNDPVARGFVASLARPGGNTTGFTHLEYEMTAKWLALLKQIAPQVTQAAVMGNFSAFDGASQLKNIEAAAPALGVAIRPVEVSDAGEIERGMAEVARVPNMGLIVTENRETFFDYKLIVALAAHYRLPAIYNQRYFVAEGGLISYAPDDSASWRGAGAYVDRIFKGANPGDLPVQQPTKFELVINLKTAKALGLTVPPTLLALADEVIE
jgi:putative tryptophan/tyrosine transport system substrate-binding protein